MGLKEDDMLEATLDDEVDDTVVLNPVALDTEVLETEVLDTVAGPVLLYMSRKLAAPQYSCELPGHNKLQLDVAVRALGELIVFPQ